MFRRCSTVLITLVLVVASAVTSTAQSGRGRQLRIQGTLPNESVAPAAAEVRDNQKTDPGSSDSLSVATRRGAGLIYNDVASIQKKEDGDYHMTKADKKAGWILLGLAVLATISMISQD